MKLAILSGTFNPIHKSHIAIANYVKDKFDYDEVLLVPACHPPLKHNTASAIDRLNMVKLAAENEKNLTVSDVEFEIKGKSYSYLTARKLYEKYDIDGKLGFIMGTDAYVGLPSWYAADSLKSLVEFVVFEREIPFSDIQVKAVQSLGFNMLQAKLPFVNISSSAIRNKIKNNEDISKYVKKEVEDYINEHGLYK